MDAHQKRVLRFKGPVIAAMLSFTPHLQKILFQRKLLNDTIFQQVISEATESGQMFKYLEVLPFSDLPDSFDKLCELLEDEGISWLSDELQADLLAESGDLPIEEYIIREAGVIVHRHFGSSKRMSEVDKRELTELLALRKQASKEAWKRQLDKVRGDLQETSHLKASEGEKVVELLDKINAFIRVQKLKINVHNHSMVSTSFGLKDSIQKTTTEQNLSMLDSRQGELLEALARVIMERDKLDEERKKCLSILRVDKKAVQLDQAVANALKEAAAELNRQRLTKIESDELALMLENRVKEVTLELTKELANKDRHIQHLENTMREKERKYREFDKELYEARRAADEAQDMIEIWKARCEALEKTRRLGYLYGEGKVSQAALSRVEKDLLSVSVQPLSVVNTNKIINSTASSSSTPRIGTPRSTRNNADKTTGVPNNQRPINGYHTSTNTQKNGRPALKPINSKSKLLKY